MHDSSRPFLLTSEVQFQTRQALRYVEEQPRTVGGVDRDDHQVVMRRHHDAGGRGGQRRPVAGGGIVADGVFHAENDAHALLECGAQQAVEGDAEALELLARLPLRRALAGGRGGNGTHRPRRRNGSGGSVQGTHESSMVRGFFGGGSRGDVDRQSAGAVVVAPRRRFQHFQFHLVGQDLQSVLLAEVSEGVYHPREVQDVVDLEDEFRRHGGVYVAGGPAPHAHEVDPAGVAESGPLDGPPGRGAPLGEPRAEEDVVQGGGAVPHPGDEGAVVIVPHEEDGGHEDDVGDPDQRDGDAVHGDGEDAHLGQRLVVGVAVYEETLDDEVGGSSDDRACLRKEVGNANQ